MWIPPTVPSLLLAGLLIAAAVSMAAAAESPAAAPNSHPKVWRGLHLMIRDTESVKPLERFIADTLAPMGINALVLEVDYGFKFHSHPELSNGTLTREDARGLARTCREHGIRLIPLFNCLGHQSWAENTGPLLTKHPEFDETPQVPKDNQGIYCRSWCPLHPDVNRVVFDLMDELVDAFHADAIHVGMDEVFLIGSDQCPRCRGKDPAELFARAVNDYHKHFVEQKKLTMLMWGDRLIDANKMPYGEWEASKNGTAPAIDRIPKDIVICDWHYEPMADYPSVAYFQQKGFRVWPSPWHDLKAANALLDCAEQHASSRMLGALVTGWDAGDGGRALASALAGQNARAQKLADVTRGMMKRLPDAQAQK